MAEDQVDETAPQETLERPKLLPTTTREQREANWRTMVGFIDQVSERYGMPIEEGIKEPVVALNIHEVQTNQSCEGHMDHGPGAPWVMFGAEATDEIAANHEALDALREEEQRKQAEEAPQAEIDALHERGVSLNTEIRRHNLEAAKKTLGFLTEFYQDRRVPLDRQLVMYTLIDGSGALMPQGGAVNEIEPPEIRQQKLAEYQGEMTAFGEFLKNKYLATE